MKKPLIIVGLCILGLFFASFDFKNSDAGVFHYLETTEGYIGEPFNKVEQNLGKPDQKNSDSSVHTYIVKDKNEEITGYRLFGDWQGEVGCYTEQNVVEEGRVISLYQLVVQHMGEEGRTIGQVSSQRDSFDFTDNHQVARRLDTMWEVDMSLDGENSYVTFFIYDEEKHGCHQELLIEAKRIEERLGL